MGRAGALFKIVIFLKMSEWEGIVGAMTTYRTRDFKKRDGTTSFRVTWFDRSHRHKCKTFESKEARWKFIREMKQEDNAKKEVERQARRSGDYVARFSRLDTETQNLLLGSLDAVVAAGGLAEDVKEAVDLYVPGLGGGHTVQEAIEAHLEEVARLRRPKTFKGRRDYLRPFAKAFGDVPLGRLTRADCRGWILEKDLTVSKSEHRHKALSALLRYCVRREWLRANPMDGLEKPRPDRPEEVRIFSVKEAQRLLRAAEKVSPRMVPFYAIGLFAGLRPERELPGLEGRDVDLKGGEIYVRRKLAKTGNERMVPISGNLRAWLERYPVGERVGWSGTEHKRVLKAAKLAWSQDVMRHTRASFRLAQTRDAVRTADEMGHEVATLKRHYANRRIPSEEVEKFWKIAPKRTAKPKARRKNRQKGQGERGHAGTGK